MTECLVANGFDSVVANKMIYISRKVLTSEEGRHLILREKSVFYPGLYEEIPPNVKSPLLRKNISSSHFPCLALSL